jgi:putative chitinase
MGNSGIPGGSYRFSGRGLIQVTGRDQYRLVGFENNFDALALPHIPAQTAAAYWQANNLHIRTIRELNRQQFDAISRAINNGNHGLDERWTAYQRALSVLKPRASGR